MTASQHDDIRWTDGDVPLSTRFDDPYFSRDDGLAESTHVFLDGNHLPARFRPGFHIAELGFGTGLNMLAALAAWQRCGATGPLHYTGFEAFPMPPADLTRALSAFPSLIPLAAPLIDAWRRGETEIRTNTLLARIIPGDARQTLPGWPGRADAWFLDGFAPARNPELWQPALMAEVARHTAPGGTFATYTAAGHVRRALQAAGFSAKRRPGYGRKRHMTAGRLDPEPNAPAA